MPGHPSSKGRKLLFTLILLLAFLLVAELFSSAMFFYRYRHLVLGLDRYSKSSLLMLAEKVFTRDRSGILSPTETTSYPKPLLVPDSIQGYANGPGKYRISMHNSLAGKTTVQEVTILPDGSRYTGFKWDSGGGKRQRIHVYGDSFVFGWGVNDEQTFSYLLQQARPDVQVGLYAAGGYSLSNAYLQFKRHASLLGKDDIVVLGYAEFYKVRDVAAPSRLRDFSKMDNGWFRNRGIRHLKADVDDRGRVKFSLVPLICSEHTDGYCDRPDPSPEYMNRVSAALVNEVARGTKASVYLLRMSGEDNDPLFGMLDPGVIVVNGRPADFDYDVRDDVMGYDSHPGPYWHYAIYKRLNGILPPVPLPSPSSATEVNR